MLKEEISARIEEFCKIKGWLKKEFAEIIKINPQHVNLVFKGKLDPLKYIDVLVKQGADKYWLLTGEIKSMEKSNNVFKIRIEELQQENKNLKKKLAAYKAATKYFDKAKGV
jgi:hypothetical protein